jgi:hypothetical protein
MKLTHEQQDALDKFHTGKSLRVAAYAGTGKTYSMVALAKSAPYAKGTYICFNKSIAVEAAKKFPSLVSCKTVHGLAFGKVIKLMNNDIGKMTGDISGGFLAARLNLQEFHVVEDLMLSARGVGFLVAETIKSFCRSADTAITTRHVPLAGRLSLIEPGEKIAIRDHIKAKADLAWARMTNPRDSLPLGHDGYLKLWALGKPKIPGNFIMLDEAQDTNGVVLGVLRHQKAQTIVVGDSHQAIYEWRGAINAMTELKSELEANLTTSFRFGETLANNATRILALLGAEKPLRGNPAKQSSLTHIERPDAMLFRSNARLIDQLIECVTSGERVHVVGGVAELQSVMSAIKRLQAGQSVESPLEFFGFKDWTEVVAASMTPEGAELRRWVKIVSDFSVDAICAAINATHKSEDDADIVLSTGHKSKGREWGNVVLCDDFLPEPKNPEEAVLQDAELRLLYVAATRAMSCLDMPERIEVRIQKLLAEAQSEPGSVAA